MAEQTQIHQINLAESLMSMHKEEREGMFKLFAENQELFQKLLPNTELLQLAVDPTTEHDHPLIRHFQAWQRSNTPT
jgi:hypothetical protein